MTSLRLVDAAADPSLMDDLTPQQLVGLIAQAGALLVQKGGAEEPDRLIDPEEAAGIVGLSPRYIKRHKASLPFVRQRVPNAPIRCSIAACRQWVAGQARRRVG